MATVITEQNATQVLMGFLWKEENQFPLEAITGSIAKGFEVDQTVLLPYLMKFQKWLLEQKEVSPEDDVS